MMREREREREREMLVAVMVWGLLLLYTILYQIKTVSGNLGSCILSFVVPTEASFPRLSLVTTPS